MKKEYIDLHVHTNASDGIFTPSQVVDTVIKMGLRAFSITDHDTIYGFAEAKKIIMPL
jgi:predicted metal-dependent phosphoesterase TrpH